MPNAPESFEPQLPPVTESLTAGDNPQTAENTSIGDSIGDSVGDSVTQTNLMTLGVGPSTPIAASYLARAHAQAVLFTNAVQQQYQESLTGLSVATESVRRIFNLTTNSD
jgi:hypothetical protein